MCGIIGYIGNKPAVGVILEGLKRLEYRGYDSAGIAVVNDSQMYIRRASGKVRDLEAVLRQDSCQGNFGIGHTRWATHGRPTEENAHPHRDCKGEIVVVHNGIIENYLSLKEALIGEGHQFITETDTEVIAHLIEKYFKGSLEEAVQKATEKISGNYALVVLSVLEPNKIVATRVGPPIIIGMAEGETFIASDIPAILNSTRDMIFLEEGEIATLAPGSLRITNSQGQVAAPRGQRINWDPVLAEKGGYKHFMLKEIFEQPRAIKDTTISRVSRDTGRVILDEMKMTEKDFLQVEQIRLIACGTSWHAALAGKFMIEKLARIPVEVDYGSEYRYRQPIVPPNTLVIFITQSGETADTLAAQREVKLSSTKNIAICNVVGSMVTREADAVLYTHAGPEIGVAATKSFTTQLTSLYLLALFLASTKKVITLEQGHTYIEELAKIPQKIESIFDSVKYFEELARHFFHSSQFLFLGRGIHYPIALEGALKLKEISYIHAEGFPAGEMKHGPNALIDETLPVVVIATSNDNSSQSNLLYEKTISNIKEVKARDGIVISLVTQFSKEAIEASDYHIQVPTTSELLLPILETVPLQLLSYYIADRRGCDVDQPRNLAKSVTVE